MPDINDLARSIFPKAKDVIVEALGDMPSVQVSAVVVEVLEDGTALVDFFGDGAEGEDGESRTEVPSSAYLEEGDEVIVTLKGNVPIDSTSTGWGRRVVSRTATLEERADEIVINVESVTETADGLADRVTATEEGITENASAIEEEVNTRSAYIRFTSDDQGNPLIELGAEDSPLILRLTNEQIGFLNAGELVAYITGQLLNIANAKVSQTLQFGDFAWIPRSNRNLALKWIGGDE